MKQRSVVEIPVEPAESVDAAILRVGVAAIWLATAAGCLHPVYRTIGEAYLVPLGLGPWAMVASCVGEAMLAFWLLARPPGKWLTLLQAGAVAFFTAALVFVQPDLLHHPLGVLSKNVPIVAAVVGAFALRSPSLKETGRIILWLGVAFIWLYEGLVPKILFQSELELSWVASYGLSPFSPELSVRLIGAFEIILGLLLLVPGVPLKVRRATLGLGFVLLLFLPAAVVYLAPEFLVHPFMPLGKNLTILACTAVLWRQSGRGLGPWIKPFVFEVPAQGPSPFSRLSSRGGRVGADFFAREGLIDEHGEAHGLLDDLEELRSAAFEPEAVHPEIRRFYERTVDFEMDVQGHWLPPFSWGAPLFRRLFSRPFGQFGLPLDGDPAVPLKSQILPLRSERDGRSKVRGWVRVHPELDLTVYAAAYSKLTVSAHPMMSVGFVLPFGSLTTVLQPDNIDGDGIRISTCTHDPAAGNYLVLIRGGKGWAVKLPFLHEQLEVRPGQDDQESLEAIHQLWLFGLPYLTMRYAMTRSSG